MKLKQTDFGVRRSPSVLDGVDAGDNQGDNLDSLTEEQLIGQVKDKLDKLTKEQLIGLIRCIEEQFKPKEVKHGN